MGLAEREKMEKHYAWLCGECLKSGVVTRNWTKAENGEKRHAKAYGHDDVRVITLEGAN